MTKPTQKKPHTHTYTRTEAIELTHSPDDVIFCDICRGWVNTWEAAHNLTYIDSLAECCQIRVAGFESWQSAHTAHTKATQESGYQPRRGWRLA